MQADDVSAQQVVTGEVAHLSYPAARFAIRVTAGIGACSVFAVS